jgi:hypothetical protein
VFGLLPALWRKRLAPERIRNLTLFTLDSKPAPAGRRGRA